MQGFTGALAFGALVWFSRLFVAKVEAGGYSLETATIVGNLLTVPFGAGALLAIPAGHLGDVWQQRDRRGRAILNTIALLGAIPFLVAVIFIPLPGLIIPEPAGLLEILWAIGRSFFTNGWVVATTLLAIVSAALLFAIPPNWAALVNDVNLPEHRGTVIGMNRLAAALGNAIGVGLTGVALTFLTARFAPPWNYAIGIALFQVFILPTGLCYYLAIKTVAEDIATVQRTLAERAEVA